MSENALFDQVRSTLAEVFDVDSAEINAEAQFGDLPKWDSMGHMDLMLALESAFGVQISAETISQLTSVPAILTHVDGLQNA
ncbi:MAG: acyl carrier protein [Chloroflexi bacterium]|nr:acyl carrier protein [Chloroflexota bacterium]